MKKEQLKHIISAFNVAACAFVLAGVLLASPISAAPVSGNTMVVQDIQNQMPEGEKEGEPDIAPQSDRHDEIPPTEERL